MTVTAGGSGNATVNIDRTNFVGEVALSLLNPPAGVTASFAPPSPTSNSATVTISVGPGVTPASYPLQVLGVGAGVGERTATLMLTVQPQLASFTVNLSPGAFSLPRGNSAVVNITLARTDYAGPIALAFENAPPGITGTIVPATTTGNSATFTINVGDAVAPGSYQLRIRGTAPGFVDRVAFVQVTVTVPIGADVEYLYCNAAEVPVFFAYQDASGPWKQVTPVTTGTFTKFAFTLVQGRGGVMAVRHTTLPMVADALNHRRFRPVAKPRGPQARIISRSARALPALLVDQYQTDVAYATAAELAQDGIANCQQTLGTKSVTGTVTGINTPEVAVVSLGERHERVLRRRYQQPRDVRVACRRARWTWLRRGCCRQGTRLTGWWSCVASTSLTVAPFRRRLTSRPQLVAAATATATITGSGTDRLEMFTDVVTSNGRASLWFDGVPSANSTRPWGGLSPTTMIAGDFHGLAAFATPTSGAVGDFRVTLRYLGAVADQTLAIGPVLNAPTATQVAAGTYPRFRFQGSVQSEYNKGVSVDILPSDR